MKRGGLFGSRAVALAITLAALPALSQIAPEVAASRNALIDDAYRAAQAGEHQRALDLGQQAGQLEWSPSLRAFVAEQQNALGQFAAALGSAQLCAQGAERDLAMLHREEFLTGCRALIATLQARVAHVTVRRPAAAPPGLHVAVNHQDLAANLLDVPYVITPGALTVEATAPGFAPWSFNATTEPGSSVSVEITLRALTASCAPGTEPDLAAPGQCSARNAPRVTAPGESLRTLGWIALGAGGVFTALGAVVNLVERDALSTLVADGCFVPPGGAPMGGAPCAGDVRLVTITTDVSIAGYVAGVAFDVAAALLVLSARARTAVPHVAGVSFAPASAGVAFALRGTF